MAKVKKIDVVAEMNKIINGDTIEIESKIPMSDLNMYKHKFEGAASGLYKVRYICPYYTLNMSVSWDGERLV